MASAWGVSWGSSWGDSWGAIGAAAATGHSPYHRAEFRSEEGRYDSVLADMRFERPQRKAEPLQELKQQVDALIAEPAAAGVAKRIAALERRARSIEGLNALIETRIRKSERAERLTAISEWLAQAAQLEREQHTAQLAAKISQDEVLFMLMAAAA